jgi:acetoin utilization protein AcuB
MDKLTVRGFMTASPLTVSDDEPIAHAAALMGEHGIRHLPVVCGEHLVGVVSERDLALIAALGRIDPERMSVGEAMSRAVYQTSPETSLEWLASEMAVRKQDLAVVVEAGRVVGVFTSVDAERALESLLARARRRRRKAHLPLARS